MRLLGFAGAAGRVADHLTDPANEATLAESNRKIGLLLERLDKTLADFAGPWLLGRQFTLVDIEAFVLVDPFLAATLPLAGLNVPGAVREWHHNVSERAAVRQMLEASEPTFLPGPEHSRWG